jgi:hypothetical protein
MIILFFRPKSGLSCDSLAATEDLFDQMLKECQEREAQFSNEMNSKGEYLFSDKE